MDVVCACAGIAQTNRTSRPNDRRFTILMHFSFKGFMIMNDGMGAGGGLSCLN